jgi:hypothetical protein
MIKKYQLNIEDFKDPHESNEFWIRLQQIVENSNHTLDTLSEAIDVPRRTLGRFLSRQTHADVLRMVYDISNACGVKPALLFDKSKQIPHHDLTNIKSIDRMLMTAYNGGSVTGCDGFAKTCSDQYRLRHHRWRINNQTQHDRVTQLLKIDEEGYPSLSIVDEIALNNSVSETNKMSRQLYLHRAYIAGETIVVQYTMEERKTSPHSGKTVSEANVYTDHVTLERPIADYVENGRLVPRIKIRQWVVEKKFRLD